MSYILEALRKSERERQLKQAPSLAAVATAEPPHQSRPWLPWAAIGALVIVNGAGLGYFLLGDRRAPETAAARPPEASVPAPAATPAPSAPAIAATPPGPARAPGAPAALPQVPPVIEPAPLEQQAEEERLPPPRLAPAPHPADKAQRLRPASKPVDGGTADEDKPAYRINVLAYSKDPKDRFAVINMSRYVKGDRLPDGAQVEEIETDGVVLVRNGRKLRIAH